MIKVMEASVIKDFKFERAELWLRVDISLLFKYELGEKVSAIGG